MRGCGMKMNAKSTDVFLKVELLLTRTPHFRMLCHVQDVEKDSRHECKYQKSLSRACLYRKTLEKKHSGIQKRVLCERLFRMFRM